jgi:glycerol-3-phosphate acyltransferase PlsY
MRGKIDTNYEGLRMVETKPVRHERTDRTVTALDTPAEPLITVIALVVWLIASWLTMYSSLVALRGGSPTAPLYVRLKRRATYLLGTYVLAVENSYLLEVN